MNSVLEISRIILPIVLVSGMVAFVIIRMKYKYKKTGSLGKKQSKRVHDLLANSIPLK